MRLGATDSTLRRMSRTVTPTGSRRPEFRSLEERLIWSRETAPLTQAELAAHLGISKRTVQNYEAGVGHPSEERLLLWANACDADYEFLAGDFYSQAPSFAQPRGRRKTPSNHGCVSSTRRPTSRPGINCQPIAA